MKRLFTLLFYPNKDRGSWWVLHRRKPDEEVDSVQMYQPGALRTIIRGLLRNADDRTDRNA